ncbi:MAG: Flp pilus assembly complex ATPase component TadA [Clostridia bacterium]|nr:Flp pilus assembly complex ATPase component TadA [Clostridia bacterium]
MEEEVLLSDIINKVKDIMEEYKDDQELKLLHQKRIDQAAAGSPEAKVYVKEEIMKICLKQLGLYITANNIDDIIKQYHVNYYENIYGEDDTEDKKFEKLFEHMVLSEYDDFEKKVDRLVQIIYQELYGLGVIDELCEGHIDETGVNGKDYIWIQVSGLKRQIKKLHFQSQQQLQKKVSTAISFDSKNDITASDPIVYCQRMNGSRVTAAIPPVAKYPILNIRHFHLANVTKYDLVDKQTLTKDAMRFVELIFQGRPNFLIIGQQGSGKSTLLRVLLNEVSDAIGIGTIENMFELNLDDYYPSKNVIALQSTEKYPADKLFELMLRQNRDIILLGEIRSSNEAVETINAMLRQCRGSAATFHSSSPTRAVHDLRNLCMRSSQYKDFLTAQFDVADAIDLIMEGRLDYKTGKRYINRISVVEADEDTYKFDVTDVFRYDHEAKELRPHKCVSDKFLTKLLDYGMPYENITMIKEMFARFEKEGKLIGDEEDEAPKKKRSKKEEVEA